MGIRAYARVTFPAAGSPSTSVRRGFGAVVDTAVGRTTFTLERAIDRNEGCVLCSFLGTANSAALSAGTSDADVAAADTTVEIRCRQSSGALADPAVGTGFYVAVLDSDDLL